MKALLFASVIAALVTAAPNIRWTASAAPIMSIDRSARIEIDFAVTHACASVGDSVAGSGPRYLALDSGERHEVTLRCRDHEYLAVWKLER